jgi:chromosome segregation ATPase
MNNLNYASREASQRLVDVGIVLEAENKRLREERDRYLEELVVAKNVIKSDESQIKNLIKRNDEMRDDCIRTAEQRDKLADENAKLREAVNEIAYIVNCKAYNMAHGSTISGICDKALRGGEAK